jgi:hypothetical protein
MRFLRKPLNRKLDKHEQQVIENVSQFGCQVQFVFDPEGNDPDFSYSIGFPSSVGQPEVIVYGLKLEVMHSMVNEMRRQCADGLLLSDWLRVNGLLEGFDCILRRVTDPEAIKKHFGWAIWYHRSQRGLEMDEVFQIVWPGALQGLFPWEEGCDEYVGSQQPPLWQKSLH